MNWQPVGSAASRALPVFLATGAATAGFDLRVALVASATTASFALLLTAWCFIAVLRTWGFVDRGCSIVIFVGLAAPTRAPNVGQPSSP
jgi:hypothetical protein